MPSPFHWDGRGGAYLRCNNFGSLAMLLAIRLASSSVSTLGMIASLSVTCVDISERLAIGVNHLESARYPLDGPRCRESCHWRLSR